MSFIKSKHSGWTWDLKRTPFGGGGGVVDQVGSFIQDNVVTPISNVATQVDQTVSNAIPGGWATIGAAVAAPFTGGASLGLDASAIAAADGIALSTYGVPAAEAMATYGATAAELGLPAAATAADVGAVAGTASAEFAATEAGQQAIGMTAPAIAPATAQTPQVLAQQLGYSDPIAAIAGGVNPADLGMTQAGSALGGSTLQDILGYAKTGSQIVGGLGKIAGGVSGLTSGARVNPQQADPFAQYRSGLASQLNQLLQDPNTVTTTPGYQFNLSQGLQAQQAKAAAQGRLVSGGALLESQAFGQQLAGQTYQQQLQNLAQLSGAYQSPATGTGAVQNTALSNTANMFGGIGAIAQGLGVATGQSPLDTLYSNYNKSSPAAS